VRDEIALGGGAHGPDGVALVSERGNRQSVESGDQKKGESSNA
jgi:hypothetical protein